LASDLQGYVLSAVGFFYIYYYICYNKITNFPNLLLLFFLFFYIPLILQAVSCIGVGFAGTVADLLDMEEQEIAQLKILPAALAGLTEAEDMAALQALAGKVGLELPVLMSHYGHHAVAKFLYEGDHVDASPKSLRAPSKPHVIGLKKRAAGSYGSGLLSR
jgi:hypothetical protein